MSKKQSKDILLRELKRFLITFIAMLIATPIMTDGKFDFQVLYSVLVATIASFLAGGQKYVSATLAERKRPNE